MCGRYTLTQSLKKLAERFKFSMENWNYPPRFNIAPTQNCPVVISSGREPELKEMRWGLIPSWSKDMSMAARMINARSETIIEKPSFKNPFKNRRCLVPADGFIEWRAEGKKKIPFHIRKKDHSIFTFAGLWSEWKGPDGPIQSFTIITTEANIHLKELHHRMPVILPDNLHGSWLNPQSTQDQLLSMLKPLEGDLLEFGAVSTLINNPKNDSQECLAPLE